MENQENISKKEQYDLKKQAKQEGQKKQQQAKKTKSIIIWSVAVLAIVIAVFAIVKLSSNAPDTSGVVVDAISESDQIKGNPDAKLVLTEYSDFQCPACALYVPFVKKVTDEFSDRIAFVYRHFPLKNIHPNAESAAWAAEAAGEQDSFWAMHDILFENQNQWAGALRPKNSYLEYAEELNLDIDKFEADYGSKKIKDKVDNDLQSALRARLDSTPTFLINGNKIQNPRNENELRTILNAALNVLEPEQATNQNNNATSTNP